MLAAEDAPVDVHSLPAVAHVVRKKEAAAILAGSLEVSESAGMAAGVGASHSGAPVGREYSLAELEEQ